MQLNVKGKAKSDIGIISSNKDGETYNRISKIKDPNKKYKSLCDFMYKVIPYSYYWNLAKNESLKLVG